jgi:hypothetical protein
MSLEFISHELTIAGTNEDLGSGLIKSQVMVRGLEFRLNSDKAKYLAERQNEPVRGLKERGPA